MKIRTDPLRPKCGEEEETAYHLLGKCSAMMMADYAILVSYLIDIKHTFFWGLQKPHRDLCNLSVISGLHIEPKLITASVLDSILSSSKIKVKVKVTFSFQTWFLSLEQHGQNTVSEETDSNWLAGITDIWEKIVSVYCALHQETKLEPDVVVY